MKTRTAALSWVLGGALFATLAVDSRAQSQAIAFAADVPLVMSDGMPCIEVRIGDGKPVLFGIDTGDVNSVIDTTVAPPVLLVSTDGQTYTKTVIANITESRQVPSGRSRCRRIRPSRLAPSRAIAR